MNLEETLLPVVVETLTELYQNISENQVQLQKTRKDFDGDITLVVFPFLKASKKGPEQTGEEIANLLMKKVDLITGFNTVKGFLNLEISDQYWLNHLKEINAESDFGKFKSNDQLTMVEFSSPNTNKPLHLGHLRNIFLGHSVSRILKQNGQETVQTQIINDRGVHICKSMYAWQKAGGAETPDSSRLKGDKLVGKYYVEFDKILKSEREELHKAWNDGNLDDVSEEVKSKFYELSERVNEAKGEKAENAAKSKLKEFLNNQTACMQDVKEMLRKWEAKDPEVYQLWQKMNGWVYDGFNATYKTMGVDFDKLYYESETYITGKELVDKGLSEGVFFKKDDGSVWIDLTDEGLDQKLLLRSDGTAVYMTQDIGTAYQRFLDYPKMTGMVYTVGNEQDYHFKVLFLILKKLGYKWAEQCYHLSYGMVELRNDEGEIGKMKSREGTVVDADDLMAEVIDKAKATTEERGHIEGMSDQEKEALYRKIGLGGLKYYLLKVDPKKNMAFNPEESVDLNGNTGPFIQYTHARISSLLNKAENFKVFESTIELHDSERELIKHLSDYPEVVKEAAKEYSPALICNYVYDLVKAYNSFYQSVSIFKEEDANKMNMRLVLSKEVAQVVKSGMWMLGIDVPDRM